MSESMPARLAVTGSPLGHRRRWRGARKSACRLCCQPSQDLDGGAGALDDGPPLDGPPLDGSPAGDELDAVGVGVGSLPLGADHCVGGTSDGVGASDAEELVGVGVGVGVVVGDPTGQVGTFVLV
jgi:hypothetical protein